MNKILLDRDELDDILYEVGVVENQLANFILVVKALKEHFEGDMLNDIYALLSCFECQLCVARNDLLAALGHYDELFFK